MVMSADRGNAALRALGAGLKGAAGGVQNIQKQRQEQALMALKGRQVEAAESKARPDIEQNMGWVNEGKDPMEIQRRMNQLLAVTSAKSPYITDVPTVSTGPGAPTKRRVPGGGGAGRRESVDERYDKLDKVAQTKQGVLSMSQQDRNWLVMQRKSRTAKGARDQEAIDKAEAFK